ncbi:MAG: UvrB/UvrC motif-containing protein [Verrucomicrobiota bacterium]
MNGKSVEVHVCEKCIPEINQDNLIDFDIWEAVSKVAAEKGIPDPCKVMEDEAAEISAKSLLLPSKQGKKDANVCSECGFTNEDLRKTGRLGCSRCYEVFDEMLEDVFNDCQKGNKHHGKIPSGYEDLKIKKIKQDLQEAIDDERFEDAALLRDQLAKLSHNC